MTKVQAQRVHSKRRAMQRYGMKLSSNDLSTIVYMIQSRKSLGYKKLTNTRSEHIVQYQDHNIRVVYDKSRKNICTFLPMASQ